MRIVREAVVATLIALIAWTVCAAILSLSAWAASMATGLAVHSVVAPVLFALVGIAYFRRESALRPSGTALLFTLTGFAFALVTAATVPERGMAALRSVTGTWLPLALVFVVTWGIGLAFKAPADRMGPRSEHVEDS